MLIGLLTAQYSIAAPKSGDYRQQMRNFVQQISAYAKQIHPNFIVIAQNGVNLTSLSDSSYLPAVDYIEALDGIGQEGLFYGYDKDDQATPLAVRQRLSAFLDRAKDTGNITILVTDYCVTQEKIDDSYNQNQTQGYIAFAATHRELDTIPAYPSPIHRENARNIKVLQDVKNFLYLLFPDSEYLSKKAWLAALKKTNYDLIIIDLFYDKAALTKTEIQALKQKANGKKRLVIAYMSIGEAEDYRYYWQDNWRVGHPAFIVKQNPEWPGNYTVSYWDKAWQQIIFGHQNAYNRLFLAIKMLI